MGLILNGIVGKGKVGVDNDGKCLLLAEVIV